jgi:putative flippase GtrA
VPEPATNSLIDRARSVAHEVAKFGVVGALGAAVDIGLFNFLLVKVIPGKPLTAGTISFLAAVCLTYVGNRFWTYRHRERTGYGRETLLFFFFNVIGLTIQLGILAFTHYTLGLTTLLDDNLSKNVVGLALATLFRFWAYRKYVFPDAASAGGPAAGDPTADSLASAP